MKQCRTCKEEKEGDQFCKNIRAKDGLNGQCKACKAAWEREYRTTELNRKYNLRKAFGLELEEYYSMLKAQNGVCAICEEPEKTVRAGKVQRLAVDHCHTTGVIRGLLCNSCNRGIGKLRDSPKILKKALLYLLDYEVYKEDYEDSLSRHRVQPEHGACVGALEAEREHEPVDGVQLRAVLGSKVGRGEGSSI